MRIAAHVPNAELHVFGKCGHWVQIERKDQFVEQTLNFISRLPA
jgi:pimeloyl-ACP methyl ester carboxylesterase